ncbi:hypothetical protein CC1G_10553 [Coprinopsis cinerea okayama7|uniref:Uncharacterized protein n=1 Tax=Coprinopsis cinerea (strain Okayama-7 / 130 / ATCC MYA-4618 / FGSC 9003) TaxID=240176 RepID=A8NDW5_COPC7|nr:hypothetical protein CC1G_10553 [Coprinopsis cinerea okayama7\|eukprot:XP_001832877.2 hypothetical protein CC1G_10553 [Coprinopsis cinerea okayama7\
MDTFPPEIIATILRFALIGSADDDDSGQAQSAAVDPLEMENYRLVCRRWNQTAVTTPHLWRGLKLDYGKLSPDILSFSLASFAETWFGRAGTNPPPLTLAIVETPNRASRLRCYLQPCIHQPEVLHIAKETLAIISNLRYSWAEWHFDSKQLWYSLEVLKRVNGDPDATARGDQHLSTIESINDMISLHTLSLTSDGGWIGLSGFLPLSLRRLRLAEVYYRLPWKVMQLPQLQELIFEGPIGSSLIFDFAAPQQLIQNHVLEKLVFSDIEASDLLLSLFSNTTLPNLRSIQIVNPRSLSTSVTEHNPDFTELMRQFYRRSYRTEVPGDRLQVLLEATDRVRSDGRIPRILASLSGIGITHLFFANHHALIGSRKHVLMSLGQTVRKIVCREQGAYVDTQGRNELQQMFQSFWTSMLRSLVSRRLPTDPSIVFCVPESNAAKAFFGSLEYPLGVEIHCRPAAELETIAKSGF